MKHREITAAYGAAIELVAVQYGLRPELVMALIAEGSGGSPRYLGNDAAVGICVVKQHMLDAYNVANGCRYMLRDLVPPNGTELGMPSYDAAWLKCVTVGCWYLATLVEPTFCGNIQLALQAYFEGVTRVKSASRVGRARAVAILQVAQEFSKIGGANERL